MKNRLTNILLEIYANKLDSKLSKIQNIDVYLDCHLNEGGKSETKIKDLGIIFEKSDYKEVLFDLLSSIPLGIELSDYIDMLRDNPLEDLIVTFDFKVNVKMPDSRNTPKGTKPKRITYSFCVRLVAYLGFIFTNSKPKNQQLDDIKDIVLDIFSIKVGKNSNFKNSPGDYHVPLRDFEVYTKSWVNINQMLNQYSQTLDTRLGNY